MHMLNMVSSFLRLSPRRPRPPLDTELKGERVLLRMGDPADWNHWRALRDLSRSYLKPWEPSWSPNALNYGFFCGLLRRNWRDWRQGRAYSFLIFKHSENGRAGVLLGGISLNDIQRGIAQKGTLGYWIGKPFAGQGYMAEASELVIKFAFDTLLLHRIEASCMPNNEPSKNLLKRLGFEEEGFAKAYLQIDGKWADHVLWGKTKTV